MAIEIFTWCPRINAAGETKFSTRKVQFGDGYAQVSGNGLNPRTQSWDLTFTGTESFISAIKTFLDSHGGVRAFQWKPPLEPTGLYRCDTYTPTALGAGLFNLTATFEQAFKP
ncbi:phage tail protein [Candidatus Pantoea bituminis]|uniref:phage tail protein n=1 Tax=Candidatus Pantoea bituminis TaxID=2831036 RepID=UPI001C06182A|nr:phage tail protein [Pantoea bituminis]